MSERRGLFAGLGVVVASFVVFWLSNRGFDAGRPDFFYLADAFVHGRVWLTAPLGPADVVTVGGRTYVPFAPFPAFGLVPLVALVGPRTAASWQTGINAGLAAIDVGLCWWLMSRIGVRSLVDRLWLAILFGFSTQIWWVTTRGGVWHTGHLVAALLTFAALIELEGRRRSWLIGLLAGAAFLTRAPLAFAIPFYALFLIDGLPRRDGSWLVPLARRWAGLMPRGDPVARRLLRLQRGAVRVAAGVRLSAGRPAGLARGDPGEGPLLDHPHPDEPGLPVRPPAPADP